MAHIGINIGCTANANAWSRRYDNLVTAADVAERWNVRVARLAAMIAAELPEPAVPAGYVVPEPYMTPEQYDFAAGRCVQLTGYETEPTARAERATARGAAAM
jgi:hypothetical protein